MEIKLRRRQKLIIIYGKSKQIIILILLLMTFCLIDEFFIEKENNNDIIINIDSINNDFSIKCDKWIVLTAFNSPSSFIEYLEKEILDFKIVVVGNEETDDIKWNQFRYSDKLFYLSFRDQYYLNFSIIKYLKPNSYYRKIIGYLYAIQHGAREIYEIDEDIEFNVTSKLNLYYNDTFVSYGIVNDSIMMNPYIYFGEKNIWPRGFRINDIGKQFKQKILIVNSSNINLKPLIFQGLINFNPDLDSIFYLTRIKFNNSFIFNISNKYPLIYFPNNYVPINSINTRYLYCIFPFLMFPISFDEYLGDIWRGYTIQYFAWRMRGAVIYYFSDSFRRYDFNNNNNFKIERKNFHDLNIYLNILESISDIDINKPFLDLFNRFLTILYDKNVITKNDMNAYQAYLKDLINIGYNFSNLMFYDIEYSHKNYLNTKSELKFNTLPNLFIINNHNLKLISHTFSRKIYNDILLIVNYNRKGFLKINQYIQILYKKFFPNIIFIYPSITKESDTISCKESRNGYYSYKCFIKVYLKYPNYRGYLYINDDLFIKVWELSDFNFDIPWFFKNGRLDKKWRHYNHCRSIYNLFQKNIVWKDNIIQFNGYFDILKGLSDFYYLPNNFASKICHLFQKMYNSQIFLECVIPNSMAILSSPIYQIIYIEPLWGKDRINVIKFLYSKFDQLTIHPIKFSNKTARYKVNLYIYFINANEY